MALCCTELRFLQSMPTNRWSWKSQDCETGELSLLDRYIALLLFSFSEPSIYPLEFKRLYEYVHMSSFFLLKGELLTRYFQNQPKNYTNAFVYKVYYFRALF